jgi:hypothetical protein
MNHDRECSVQPDDAQRRNHWLAVTGEITGKSVGKWTRLQRDHGRRFDRSAHRVGDEPCKRGSQRDGNSRTMGWLELESGRRGRCRSLAGKLPAARLVLSEHIAPASWA